MPEKRDLIKTIILAAAIIVAAVILAQAIKEGFHYLGDAINAGLFRMDK